MSSHLVNPPGLDHDEEPSVLGLRLLLEEPDRLHSHVLQSRLVVGLIDLVVPGQVGVGEDAKDTGLLHGEVHQLIPVLHVHAARVVALPLLNEVPLVKAGAVPIISVVIPSFVRKYVYFDNLKKITFYLVSSSILGSQLALPPPSMMSIFLPASLSTSCLVMSSG